MQELLAIYAEFIQAAEDHQIIPHLTNLLQDAAALADATKNVLDQARQKAAQVQATPAQ